MEANLLAFLVQNPDRYRVCQPYLEELKLETPYLKFIWVSLEGKFKEYGAFPTQQEAKWLVSQKNPTHANDLCSFIDYLYTEPVGGVCGEYLTQLLIETERSKLQDRWGTAKSIQDLKVIQDRVRVLEECLTHERPAWFSPFAADKITDPFETLKTYWGDPIPFGLPEMDHWLQGGGRRGELVTLIGLTGGGKSILSLWFALYQAMQGYTVLYESFDNVIGELLSRIWCAASGVGMKQIKSITTGLYSEKLFQVCRAFPGLEDRFWIEKHPRGTKTVKDIEHSMDSLEQHLGRPIDAVYVDYGDCVKATHQQKDTRFQLDEVFSGLGALAEEYNLLMFTPTQANRAAKFIEILDIDSAAEAWQKAWHSAIVMALCQTRLEKMQGRAKLVVPKARRTDADYIVPILMDPNNMRVLEDPDRPIQFRAQLEQGEQEQARKEGRKRMPKTQEADNMIAAVDQVMAAERASWGAPMPMPSITVPDFPAFVPTGAMPRWAA